jgi:O-antigen/teichoic acid export membrane protein
MIRVALRQRAVVAPAFVVVVGLLCGWLDGPVGFDFVTTVLILAAPTVFGIGLIYIAALVGRQEFAVSTTAVTSGRVISVALMGVILAAGPHGVIAARYLAVTLLLGEVVTFVLQWRAETRGSRRTHDQRAGLDDPPIRLGAFIRKSLPHAANSFFNYAYQKGDILLVTALAGVVVTSHYAPASQLQNLLALFPSLLASGIVPLVSSDGGPDQHGQLAYRVARRLAQVGVLAAVPVCAAVSLFMPTIITIVIGQADHASIVPATIVVWALPFLCVHTPLALALIARGLAAQATKAYAVAFAGSLALHVLLVPTHGAVGGAIASAARDVMMTVCLLVIARRAMRSEKAAVAAGIG